ncbi:type IV toxin-antitoxin system AbiEi family antitoxin domain-containing protein [Halanaerobium sp. ST460_2HS_T2]|jgi:predicted transcriptional regulator of viral defense system|uniref:type IV toxin-antitoxin system AbiEi family antitoxin domain-containing protein n=1 Tax=Halanaerobium sp. ST460_2HS_T2 TaxID=2183914 RepID=UPI000DF4706F|nr:type IV toxin-antitoxin system AbiEi family antitoxin domain-containing protein [Halanaerobium sp. ST460_2HS_T2]RCW60333.1 putative AbiEi antitoxin of type IV toxin-antitoxin system [Halanaerobium sp. ST460_2HS_T2]
MKPDTKNKIKRLFYENKGYLRARDLSEKGIHRKYLSDLLNNDEVIKLKRGLYKWNNEKFNSLNELVDVAMIIPDGVICLASALSYYELTTYTPLEYQVAIPNQKKVKNVSYPPINLYYFSEKYYQEGIKEEKIDEYNIKIYDIEKSLSDSFRYSYEIPKDILIESLKVYISRSDRNINKLMNYASGTSAESKLTKYLEVLL